MTLEEAMKCVPVLDEIKDSLRASHEKMLEEYNNTDRLQLQQRIDDCMQELDPLEPKRSLQLQAKIRGLRQTLHRLNGPPPTITEEELAGRALHILRKHHSVAFTATPEELAVPQWYASMFLDSVSQIQSHVLPERYIQHTIVGDTKGGNKVTIWVFPQKEGVIMYGFHSSPYYVWRDLYLWTYVP